MLNIQSYNGYYNKANINFTGRKIDVCKLRNIPNFMEIEANGIRGEALSSPKNIKYLYPLRSSGIDTVIDLRGKFGSEKYPQLCQKLGLRYVNIPIDSAEISSREIIENLPNLFRIIDKDNYYIACAMGLHRTDIALALNYLYNPVEHKIPQMKGHFRNGQFKYDDILRRINSINKELTPSDLKQLGWDKDFQEVFKKRKKQFIEFNESIAKSSANM